VTNTNPPARGQSLGSSLVHRISRTAQKASRSVILPDIYRATPALVPHDSSCLVHTAVPFRAVHSDSSQGPYRGFLCLMKLGATQIRTELLEQVSLQCKLLSSGALTCPAASVAQKQNLLPTLTYWRAARCDQPVRFFWCPGKEKVAAPARRATQSSWKVALARGGQPHKPGPRHTNRTI
jgi:hypothetical protein